MVPESKCQTNKMRIYEKDMGSNLKESQLPKLEQYEQQNKKQ